LARAYRTARGRSGIFLVVCPTTVLHHWLKEMHRWTPALRCVVLHSISKTGAELSGLGERGIEVALRRLQRSPSTLGLVVVVSYEGLRKVPCDDATIHRPASRHPQPTHPHF
jgi:SNF2 family DNA or RNA helicase